jgi:hypothetical protein
MLSFQPLTEITFEISKEGAPTLPFVIPLYRKLHTHLTKMKTHSHASIRSAAQAGLNKLSGYYEYALKNKCCLIATGTKFSSSVLI